MSNVKPLTDVVALIAQAGVVASQVLADGKVDFRDILKLAQLWEPAKVAIPELKDIPAAIHSLDADGISEVLNAVVKAVEVWMQIITSSPAA